MVKRHDDDASLYPKVLHARRSEICTYMWSNPLLNGTFHDAETCRSLSLSQKLEYVTYFDSVTLMRLLRDMYVSALWRIPQSRTRRSDRQLLHSPGVGRAADNENLYCWFFCVCDSFLLLVGMEGGKW